MKRIDALFYGALGQDRGILVNSNANSLVIGVNSNGQKLCIGGWCTKFSDDGGEYYIGLSAIKAAISQVERLEGKTILTEEVKKKLQIKELEDLKYALYYNKLSDKKICLLSEEVLKCAEAGDKISINIFNKSAERLFNLIDVIVRRLNMYDCRYNLCISGNIIKFDKYIIEPLWDKLYNRYDNIELFTYNNLKHKIIY